MVTELHSSYVRNLNHPGNDEETAELLSNGRTAVLRSDGTRLRVTPPGQPTAGVSMQSRTRTAVIANISSTGSTSA